MGVHVGESLSCRAPSPIHLQVRVSTRICTTLVGGWGDFSPQGGRSPFVSRGPGTGTRMGRFARPGGYDPHGIEKRSLSGALAGVGLGGRLAKDER